MSDRRGRRAARTAWGSITRDEIVDAAMRMLRTGGFEEITIRALAAEMGVAPMSLYRHIRGKDDLLDELVERLLARQWRPRCDRTEWKAWIAEAADRLRLFLVEQPAALHVYLSHPVVSPSAAARMQAMMEVLRAELPDEESARRAYGAIQTYTIGFAALEASRERWEPAEDEGDPLSRRLAAYTTPTQFAVGLGYLLGGIEADVQPFSSAIEE